jgi:hypothetical protein
MAKKKNEEQYYHNLPLDTGAAQNSDQKPVKTWVGRGPQGDGFHVTIHAETPEDSMKSYEQNPEEDDMVESPPGSGIWLAVNHPNRIEGIDYEYLDGWRYEAITDEMTKEWTTQNIHGGHLNYHVNPHYDEDPPWFTITFIYTKEGKAVGGHKHPAKYPYGWHFTTPAIPYTGNLGKDIVGSGVSTIWINPGKVPENDKWVALHPNSKQIWDDWSEYLVYPQDPVNEGNRFDPNVFNAPNSPAVDELDADKNPNPHLVQEWWSTPTSPIEGEKDWTVNLEFGKDGNLGVPNWPELDEVLNDLYAYLNQQLTGVYKQNAAKDGTVIYTPPAIDPNTGKPKGNATTVDADKIVRGSYGNYTQGSGETPTTSHPTSDQRELTQYTVDDVDIGKNASIDHGKLAPMNCTNKGRIVVQVNAPSGSNHPPNLVAGANGGPNGSDVNISATNMAQDATTTPVRPHLYYSEYDLSALELVLGRWKVWEAASIVDEVLNDEYGFGLTLQGSEGVSDGQAGRDRYQRSDWHPGSWRVLFNSSVYSPFCAAKWSRTDSSDFEDFYDGNASTMPSMSTTSRLTLRIPNYAVLKKNYTFNILRGGSFYQIPEMTDAELALYMYRKQSNRISHTVSSTTHLDWVESDSGIAGAKPLQIAVPATVIGYSGTDYPWALDNYGTQVACTRITPTGNIGWFADNFVNSSDGGGTIFYTATIFLKRKPQ